MGLSTQEKLDAGTLDEVLTVHQYGVAMTILNASMRIMRISHIDMQRVLYSLTRDSTPCAGPPCGRRWNRCPITLL